MRGKAAAAVPIAVGDRGGGRSGGDHGEVLAGPADDLGKASGSLLEEFSVEEADLGNAECIARMQRHHIQAGVGMAGQ